MEAPLRSRAAAVRVLLADRHPLYRDGLFRAFGTHPELEPVAICADGPEALEAIGGARPHVAVLDVSLPGRSGLEVLGALRASTGGPRILMLSADNDGSIVYEAIVAGAAGYLSKEADAPTICDSVLAAAQGQSVFPGWIAQDLARQVQTRASRNGNGSHLTERETEVLRLIADGMSAREMADRLYVSQTTIKTHLSNLYGKLGVCERAAAVAEAMRRGWLI